MSFAVYCLRSRHAGGVDRLQCPARFCARHDGWSKFQQADASARRLLMGLANSAGEVVSIDRLLTGERRLPE
jgi:hypothetical protein